MSASSPNPRYYKDGNGFYPRWRLFFTAPRWYLWLVTPMPLKMLWIRWNDRNK